MHQCRVWHQSEMNLNVAVNLGVDLQDPDLLTTIARLLDGSDSLPSSLTIEVTESTMMADPARAMRMLGQVHAAGIRISIKHLAPVTRPWLT